MKHALILGFLIYPVLSFTAAFAQSKETIISGRVISADDSSPLEGVVITVKGTKNLTGTMPDGAFSLAVSQEDTALLVSLAGYETKEVKIGKETSYYEISLKHTSGHVNEMAATISHKHHLVYTER